MRSAMPCAPGTPYWGVCLGVQLLAASLGARVYPGPEPEVGLLPVSMTGEARSDPVFAGAPHELLTLQWHGDTFDLPEGAVRLAGSPAYPNQAFRFQRAYGVQFHLEVSAEMAREWAEVPEYVASLERTLGSEGARTSSPPSRRAPTRCASPDARCSSAGSTASLADAERPDADEDIRLARRHRLELVHALDEHPAARLGERGDRVVVAGRRLVRAKRGETCLPTM